MKSISEFIQEQEAGFLSSDMTMEHVYIETMNACALAACYAEQANLMRFAEENGIHSITVIQEDGTEKKEKKDNIFKRAGKAIKSAAEWIVRMAREFINKIKGFFTQQKFKAMSEKVSKYDPDTKIKVDASIFAPLAILEVLGNTEQIFLAGGFMSKNMGAQVGNKARAIEGFTKAFSGKTNPTEGFKEIRSNKVGDELFKGEYVELIQSAGEDNKLDTTYGEYQKLLIDLSKKNPAKALADKADKALDAFAKAYNPSALKDEDLPVDADPEAEEGRTKSVDPDTKEVTWVHPKYSAEKTKDIEIMKEFIKVMNKCYDAGLKAADKTVYPEGKSESKSTTESYYFV